MIEDIQEKAEIGRYRIRAYSTLRPDGPLPGPHVRALHTDADPARGVPQAVRDAHRDRRTGRADHARTPITIAGMSYGALSANAKQALGWAASRVGISTTTGDGGMRPGEREDSKTLVYQVLPSRYGFDPHHLQMADAAEVVVGQGAKPGTGGLLLEQDVGDHRRGAHAARGESTSAPPCATPTSSAPTTFRSRSRSSARRPTAGSRSTSRSAPAACSRT